MRQIIVVGAGAAGLMAAWHAKTEHTAVTLLEAGVKPGRKLLSTGNGKCNLTYASEKPVIPYRGSDPAFADRVISMFPQRETLRFFEGLGMMTREKNGGIYPYTEQAQTVQAVLQKAVAGKGARLKTRQRVTGLKRNASGFTVYTEDWKYSCDAVILACGSAAAPALGADPVGYKLAAQMGHRIEKPLPALVPLKTQEQNLHALSGLRSQAEVTLLIDGKERVRERGELQWTSYGVSGIVIFQVSRFASRGLSHGNSVKLRINLLPDQNFESALRVLNHQGRKNAGELFEGIFPEKLSKVLLEKKGHKPKDILTGEQIKRVLLLAESLPVTVCETRGFAYAQVCAGGVDTREIDSETMESKLVPGLYFAGELLDVDGACGGYNLQWAWSSGYAAGTGSAAAGREGCSEYSS